MGILEDIQSGGRESVLRAVSTLRLDGAFVAVSKQGGDGAQRRSLHGQVHSRRSSLRGVAICE